MIVLGFDPGSRSSGWARLDVRGCAPAPVVPTFLEGGEVESDFFAVGALFRATSSDLVAVEWLEGIAYPIRNPGIVAQLLASSAAASRIETLARVAERKTSRVPAVKWRHLLCGRGNADDKLVKLAVERLVYGMPPRSNVHVRDAVGCAVGAAWMVGGDRSAA